MNAGGLGFIKRKKKRPRVKGARRVKPGKQGKRAPRLVKHVRPLEPAEEKMPALVASPHWPPFPIAMKPFIDKYEPQREGIAVPHAERFLGFSRRGLDQYKPRTTINAFVGSPSQFALALLVIMGLTQKSCVSLPDDVFAYEIEWWTKWDARSKRDVLDKMRVPRDLAAYILNCPHQLMIIPLALYNIGEDGGQSGHQNLLVLNFAEQTVYRVEPHGFVAHWPTEFFLTNALDTALRNFFDQKVGARRLQYLGSFEEKCSVKGPQSYQDKEEIKIPNECPGWCAAWMLWYMHMRLLYPKMPAASMLKTATQTLLDNVAHGQLASLTDFIATYANVLLEGGLELLRIASGNPKLTRKSVYLDQPPLVRTLLESHLPQLAGYLRSAKVEPTVIAEGKVVAPPAKAKAKPSVIAERPKPKVVVPVVKAKAKPPATEPKVVPPLPKTKAKPFVIAPQLARSLRIGIREKRTKREWEQLLFGGPEILPPYKSVLSSSLTLDRYLEQHQDSVNIYGHRSKYKLRRLIDPTRWLLERL
jgi:hypothetical protein